MLLFWFPPGWFGSIGLLQAHQSDLVFQAHQSPYHHQLDLVLYYAGKGKAGKGEGGKGRGQFECNCYHCGQPGHRLNQCPVKDAEMKGKGRGKGGYKGKGKGGFGKGGYGKGGSEVRRRWIAPPAWTPGQGVTLKEYLWQLDDWQRITGMP